MQRVYDSLVGAIEGRPNTKGGQYHLNMLSTTCHVYFGKVMGATPNGRLAHKSISDGTSPTHGADCRGPSAVVQSLAKLDQTKSGGTLLNLRFLPSLVKRDEDIRKLGSLIRSYFTMGGHHVQFNIVDTATLRAALRKGKLSHAYVFAGPRYGSFTGNFKFIGGNEDFDVTSSHWGLAVKNAVRSR